ncbi:MAG: Gfo/Idh/MocA family oxidoreductase [Acidobacteriota bacterium]
MNPGSRNSGRRELLRSSAAAAGVLLLKPETVFGTQANSSVEVGLVGCGNRGTWIAPLFAEYAGARIVALCDVFRDQLENAQRKLKLESARTYLGLAAWRELISSRLDAVVLQTPPCFFPEMVEAAVEAGKHVYLAKPVAVDVPGSLRILAAGEKARGRVSLFVDFQIRARPAFQEAVARVRRGDIGPPVLGHVYYHASHLSRRDRPGMSPGEARLRNWYFDRALSGDVMIERDIHVIDAANWYLGARPEKACGTGGQKARPGWGDCWDHFVVIYWYPGGVKVDFSSAEFTKGYRDLCVRLYGPTGTVDSHYGGLVQITGDNPWKGAEEDDTQRGGTIANVRAFIASIASGQYVNNVPESVESNLTAILGRTAAYEGRVVSWGEMMRRNERYEAKLEL